MKIKILAFLLILTILSSVLSGCIVYTKTTQMNDEKISKDAAVDITIEFFSLKKEDCKTIRAELDEEVYEIEIICENAIYEAEVTVQGGHIKSNSVKYSDKNGSLLISDTTSADSVISEDEAKKLAALSLDLDEDLCTFTSVEFDEGYYEIELFYNNIEYDVKVHSKTGVVTEIEKD